MRLAKVSKDGRIGVAVDTGSGIKAIFGDAALYDLDDLVAQGGEALAKAGGKVLAQGESVAQDDLEFLPPLIKAPKILCLGLNYKDHAAEGGFQVPEFPTVFGRFNSSLIGHGAPIIKPATSDQLDYEAEMVAIVGKGGKNIGKEDALSHIVAYSVFNDGSVRDYQLKTPQWTVGKNFDDTGAFGPWLVTADELPAGGAGLKIETRLNGQVVQSANTSDMVFDVVDTVSLLSTCFTLEAGDVLVMGTPSGIGLARNPPLFMKDGDVCEVEIEKIGLLVNPIKAA
ncbi:fumarylacetoacetate hydrolase family protein [Novosphingobium aerophilum]|jgi:2-keto-4-pentenoate hydratase/2-oxohepta-3-ene-1,7-dioic acid hydratase in catechol pathway|uniref:Fumarylacetoacetate hydrolase n=1 Tax=Novosphingobium pentaromativorans TaxID=205844 RepID=A0A2W5QG21_9SPHN|nr:fumarylacetoacetate hydrolase family protein [Novosphingobium sp. TCA1]PZQ53673.1 MAG: fumarylacetoacetate hydrolase [Novosphingobium pentaromativorans]GFE75734.1 5-oxopent-3-ene-1,2,5-tricarboxylate decarboxylase [Novosphingobium sp. TCA1]